MPRILLLAFIAIVHYAALAQSDFKNGFIVTSQHDTVTGLVNYHEDAGVYKSCEFKDPKTQNLVTYTAYQIAGYGFADGIFFESKKIRYSKKAIYAYTESIVDTVVFLEQIIQGRISLYKFRQTFWVGKEDLSPQQLINERKEVYVNGVTAFTNTNRHISTLNTFLFNCEAIRPDIAKVKLNERSLSRLIADYNKCVGAEIIVRKARKPWMAASISFTAGLIMSRLSFDAQFSGFEHLQGNFKTVTSPAVGLSLDIRSPKVSERMSFHVDALFSAPKYDRHNEHTIKRGSAPIRYWRDDVSIDLKQLKIPVGFRYTFPEKDFTTFFNFGVSSTVHLSSASSWSRQEKENGKTTLNTTRDALDIKRNQLGVWGGLGLMRVGDKARLSFEIRYEHTNGISPFTVDDDDLKSRVGNVQVVMSVRNR